MSHCQYLNTDLDIESLDDLSPIVQQFGQDVFVLYRDEAEGHRFASFEVAEDQPDADAAISQFCTLIEAFPARERSVWNSCLKRVFDIGYESGTESGRFRSEISAATVSRAAALGASIMVTIYFHPDSNEASCLSRTADDALEVSE